MNEKTTDILDAASNLTAMLADSAIKEAQSRANTLEVEPIGECLNCAEKFETGSTKRFCDGDCRDDYQLFNKRR